MVLLRDAGTRSLREQIDAVGEADRLFEIVGDEQDADALPFDQRGDVLDDASAHDSVERSKWLVHQQEFRLHRQHLGNGDALALSAAEMAGKTLAETAEAKAPEPGIRPRQRLRRDRCR